MRKCLNILFVFGLMVTLLCCCSASENNNESSNSEISFADSGTVDLESDVSTDETNISNEKSAMLGEYTLEDCQRLSDGFYTLLSDGSFNNYYAGSPLYFEGPDVMTYGTDWSFNSVIIDIWEDDSNSVLTEDCKLVLFCSEDYILRYGLSPVKSCGLTVSRINDDRKKEAVFFSNYDGALQSVGYWVAGSGINNNRNEFRCDTINGIPIEEFKVFPYAEGDDYCLTLPEGETFTLGTVKGTALVENEYTVDQRYFFQEYDEISFKMTPTTDGYAIFDFSDVPEGDYVLWYSYWDQEVRGRKGWSLHIRIGE